MRYASEDLMHEHEGILLGLKILERIAGTAEESGKADVKDIADMVGFLKLFADKCHHGKEEGMMFPAMEKAGIPKENGPIGQMLIEHNEGRRLIAEMAASIDEDILQASRFSSAALDYIGLMRAHIEKENKVLFPLGDKKLPVEEQKNLIIRFEEFEEEIMGEGTHEKLHKLLNDLKNKYLA